MILGNLIHTANKQTGPFRGLLSFIFAGKVIPGVIDTIDNPQGVTHDAAEAPGSVNVPTRQTPAEDQQVQCRMGLDYKDLLKSVIQRLAILSTDLSEISRRLIPNVYARRDMKYQAGDLRVDETAILLGTGRLRLYVFLQQQGVLSTEDATRNQPVEKYVDAGYLVNVRQSHGASAAMFRTEVLITPAGRRWLFCNACQGLLDGILDRDALVDRTSAAVGVPLPLIDIAPKRS